MFQSAKTRSLYFLLTHNQPHALKNTHSMLRSRSRLSLGPVPNKASSARILGFHVPAIPGNSLPTPTSSPSTLPGSTRGTEEKPGTPRGYKTDRCDWSLPSPDSSHRPEGAHTNC
ncbi:hypothetical protein RRG08_027945 [Elysia crispata]|uniref:Uncharacterized protein n=1 Tax=Elysia crispata TaxID=231223 RepID=A0AAE1DH85_9GAST|nr:hypothetical protein RRG08_027945 [Elysia crispata]